MAKHRIFLIGDWLVTYRNKLKDVYDDDRSERDQISAIIFIFDNIDYFLKIYIWNDEIID